MLVRSAFSRDLAEIKFSSGDRLLVGLLNRMVAQVELHKLRTGSYPESLGQLDVSELNAWRASGRTDEDHDWLDELGYRRSADGTAWTLEPFEGVTLPPEFWSGTGWREDL